MKTSAKGIYSTRDNPMGQPSKVSTGFGPTANADSQKANKLLQKAFKQNDSLRGSAGKM